MDDTTIRAQLAAARTRSRQAQDDHTAAKVAVKRRVLCEADSWKHIGTNDKEREIVLDAAVEDDAACQRAQAELRHAQAQVDHVQALLDDEIDVRRMLDRASRDHLSTALEAVSVHAEERGSAITILATPHAG